MTCSSEAEYNQLCSQLQRQDAAYYQDYFLSNWDSIKDMWAGFIVRKHVTYGNITNNLVENFNGKIKQLVTGQ